GPNASPARPRSTTLQTGAARGFQGPMRSLFRIEPPEQTRKISDRRTGYNWIPAHITRTAKSTTIQALQSYENIYPLLFQAILYPATGLLRYKTQIFSQ